MKSPFPGMDPYLEDYWGDTHTTLATYARDQLQRQLPEDLIACVEEHMTVGVEGADDPESHRYYPDVRVEELGPRTAGKLDPAVSPSKRKRSRSRLKPKP